MCNISYRYK